MTQTTDPREIEELNNKIRELQERLRELTDTTEKTDDKFVQLTKNVGTASARLASTFLSSVESTEKGFSKYNSTLQGLGDSALQIGQQFGIFGTALGAAVKASTFMAQKINEQNDRIANSFDKISEVGASARVTAGELKTLGSNAGLTSHTLMLLSKNANASAGALVSMAGSVGEGVKAFGQFIAIGDTQLIKYRQLGFSQEAVIETQSRYLQQMANAGVNLNRPVKDLQKESLKYLETLVALADITGSSVKSQQDALDFAASQMNYQQYIYGRAKQAQELADRGETARAEAIRAEIREKQKLVQASAEYDQEYRTGLLQALSGVDTIQTERIAKYEHLYGVPLTAINRMAVEGKDATAFFLESTTQATEKYNKQFGYLTAIAGDAGVELAKTLGQSVEMNKMAARLAGIDVDLELDRTRQGIEEQKEGRDAVMQGLAMLESLERKIRTEIDRIVATFNPFINGMEAAIKAFGVLALATAGAALALGRLGASRLPPNIPGAPGVPGTGPIVPGGAGRAPIPGGMTPGQYERYQELRRQGMTAREAMRQSGGFGAYTRAEDRIRGIPTAAPPAAPTPQQPGGLARAGRFLSGGIAPIGLGVAGYATSELGNMIGGPAGTGLQVASSAMTGAAFGSILGAPGALAGGIIGLGFGLAKNTNAINYFTKTQEEATEQTEILGSIYQQSTARAEKIVEERNDAVNAILGDNTAAIKAFTEKTNFTAEEIDKLGTELNLNTGQITQLKEVLLKQPIGNVPAATPLADTTFRETPEELKVSREEYQEMQNLDAVVKGIEGKYKDQLATLNQYKERGERRATVEDLMTKEEKTAFDSLKQRRNELADRIKKHQEYLKQENERINLAREQNRLTSEAIKIQTEWMAEYKQSGPGGVVGTSGGPQSRGGRRNRSQDRYRGASIEGGEADANLVDAHGKSGEQINPTLTSVTSKSGKSAQVDVKYKDRFQSIINWLDNQGYTINDMGGYNDRNIAGTNQKSAHAYGAAIDINSQTNPMGSRLITDMPKGVGEAAESFGLGWGGNWRGIKDAMHFSMHPAEGGIGLSDGGIAMGPRTGFPATLHGREAVIPLSPNSIFEKLATMPATEQPSPAINFDTTNSIIKELAAINFEMKELMSKKFDDMIDKLSNSNSIQERIYKASI